MSTTPSTAPFCTCVLPRSYLKFDFMIPHQLKVNLFENKGWSSWGAKKIFVVNFDLQAHNHNEGHGFEFFVFLATSR